MTTTDVRPPTHLDAPLVGAPEKARWSIIGPGLVVAATGIGAADLVATMVAGSRFGYMLLWAAVLGVLIKIALVEGAGRWSLATGKTIFEGWQQVGRWAVAYFGVYIVIWGFVYGAAGMSGTAMPLHALFPQIPLNVFAVGAGLAAAAMVWLGRYKSFEIICAVFVGIMFVVIVGTAIMTVPSLPEIASGLIPRLPREPGSIIYALGIAGGVGGTITLAAYGYWLAEKGWNQPRWMRVMRLDNTTAYVVSGLFVICTLIIGAELLYSSGITISDGDSGLIDVAGVIAQRHGAFMAPVFLIGFFAASFSSVLGVWNGVSLMFADFVASVLKVPEGDRRRGAGGTYYKAYIVWLTFPPMALLLLGKPIGLIITYGVLGSLFMPFLAVTLLFLMNSTTVPAQWRNRAWLNVILGAVAVLFIVLGVNELIHAVAPLFH